MKMNMTIKSVIDKQYGSFCRDCFAHWISCLWGRYDDSFSFEQNKEAFFYLLERLLREGKVRFQQPTKDEPFYWDAPPEVIVEHLKMGWPKEACSEGDEAIVDFFYTDLTRCPPIFWLGTDGEWHGS
jgi:hypothetical protein